MTSSSSSFSSTTTATITSQHQHPTSIPYYSAPYAAHNPTPLSSAAATPTNNSPTLLRSNSSSSSSTALPYLGFQSRQLRPPKSPLYIPAVLRPTERPSRYSQSSRATSPLTPPQSAGNSFDGPDAGILCFTSPDGIPRRLLSDGVVKCGVTRVVTDEWNDDLMEDVTGLPTQDHWKPDSCSITCDSPTCAVPFTFITRRHHCRRCGNIFCSSHSPHVVPLDQHARFHPDGSRARACESCWSDYRTWERARRSRNDSNESGSSSGVLSSDGDGDGTITPVMRVKKNVKPEVVAASVPRDWNWSTF